MNIYKNFNHRGAQRFTSCSFCDVYYAAIFSFLVTLTAAMKPLGYLKGCDKMVGLIGTHIGLSYSRVH